MTLGLFVPRSFVSPNSSCGYIPRRRPYSSMAGSGLSRVHRTAVYSGQPLTACPGYAFSPASGGGISSRAAPFPKSKSGFPQSRKTLWEKEAQQNEQAPPLAAGRVICSLCRRRAGVWVDPLHYKIGGFQDDMYPIFWTPVQN